jgi:guanylate kinase
MSHQVSDKIIVITAPSGAGKTSITKHLMQKLPNLSFSVSATTRAPRPNEIDGKDYYFISEESFKNKIEAGDFIEWEMVYEGTYYGTLKTEINKIWQRNQAPVLDIDVQGALHIKKLFPEEAFTLFIAPPSVEALRERLQKRGTETAASLEKRINKANEELSYQDKFDCVILNDQLDIACQEALDVVAHFLQPQSEKI